MEKQKEVNSLAMELQAARAASPKSTLLAEPPGSATTALSAAQLAALRRELADQERLIAGYQTENEGAVRKIKVCNITTNTSLQADLFALLNLTGALCGGNNLLGSPSDYFLV